MPARFTPYIAGYIGPNVVRRGLNPAAEAQWPLADVQNLLDIWITSVRQRPTTSDCSPSTGDQFSRMELTSPVSITTHLSCANTATSTATNI